MQANIHGARYPCARAIKGSNYVVLLDDDGYEIMACQGISDFAGYGIEDGEWSAPEPAPEERLREDVDYLLIAEMTREGLL